MAIIPLNNLTDPVKIVGPDPKPTISRDEIVSNSLPVFWGPGQPAEISDGQGGGSYIGPQSWPTPNQILKLPVCVRYYWEAPSIDVDIDMWDGHNGNYAYGTFSFYFDIDIVPVDPGVFPAHIHTVAPFPFGSSTPLVCYAVELTWIFYGTDPQYLVDGGFDYWYVPNKLTPDPISYAQYAQYDSLYRVAFEEVAEIVGAVGSSGPPILDGVPAPTQSSIDILEALGVHQLQTQVRGFGLTFPIFLGTYEIDQTQYGTFIGFPYILDIPEGYTPPPPIDISNYPNIWSGVGTNLYNFVTAGQPPYDGSGRVYFPTFDSIELNSNAFNSWAALAPNRVTFLGTVSYHVIVFSAPRDMPPQPLIDLIKAAFPFMAGYGVLIFIDTQYMIDCALNRVPNSDPIGTFTSGISGLCSSLSSVGWEYGGEVSYLDPNAAQSKIQAKITTFLSKNPANPGPHHPSSFTIYKPDGSVLT
jgi:hypothetical protein